MNTSTTISIIVVVLVIIGGGAYIMSHGGQQNSAVSVQETPISGTSSDTVAIDSTPTPSPEVSPAATPTTDTMTSENPTVSMTDTGISPATITVKSGTTITFINNGQQLHWPASDPHPIHTDVPGFDAKRGLAPGELYRFTFTKVGSFGMHDHLHPSFHAQIIVQ
ncbi:MAG TPA: cupredoxin domain-containing protein [Candidatus Andersenbacteria bacterium]|nr:cupredoxin domain-containing protein [Candidatus Andersenbacteria bacterium]